MIRDELLHWAALLLVLGIIVLNWATSERIVEQLHPLK